MTDRRSHIHTSARLGFSMIELLIVVVIMGVFAGLAIPKLNMSRTRADAAAQQVRSVFLTAQRTSLTRQYDVIVSVDTVMGGLRIAEDVNNNGAIEVSEWKFWRPIGEGNVFLLPVSKTGFTPLSPVTGITPTTSVTGTLLRRVDNLPSVLFHRDGSASSDMEIYVGSIYKNQRTDWRLVTLTRSTGRSDLYRLSGGTTWLTGTR